jgi:hypothetical protein
MERKVKSIGIGGGRHFFCFLRLMKDKQKQFFKQALTNEHSGIKLFYLIRKCILRIFKIVEIIFKLG